MSPIPTTHTTVKTQPVISTANDNSSKNPLSIAMNSLSSPSNTPSSYFPQIFRRAASNSFIPPFLSSPSSSSSATIPTILNTNTTTSATTSTTTLLKSPTSIFNNKDAKRWRWWNFLSIFIVFIILSEVAVLVMTYKLLSQPEVSPIRFGKSAND